MVIGVVIVAHGDLSTALISSAELILGAQENVVGVRLTPQDNLDTCLCSLGEGLTQVDSSEGVLILVDLFGGTPCNAAALSARDRSFPIVSGVNLPMLLEVLTNRDCGLSPEELAGLAIQAGQSSILDVSAQLKPKARPVIT